MRVEQLVFPIMRQIEKRPRLADALFRFDPWGNPFDPAHDEDPWPLIERMRADGHVVHKKAYQQWFVLGYDEVRQLLVSDSLVTSDQMETLLCVRPYTKLSEESRAFMRLWLNFVDPPAHGRLRRLVNRAFTPKRVAGLRLRIETLVAEQLEVALTESEPDMVEHLSGVLPPMVIGAMLGLPEEKLGWAASSTDELVQLISPFLGFDADSMNANIAEIHRVWGELADERRRSPRNDLLTGLVEAEDDGDRLSRQELIAVIAFLMAAGHETTTNLIGLGMVHLARNPDQRRMVRDRPELWPNAVEELLRYDTPVTFVPRATRADVDVGGATIPAGSNVILDLGAANRDPRRFDRADELVLDRDDPAPLSFGHGIHHCLGANLARLETRLALSAFVDAFGDYEITDVEWLRSAGFRGPKKLVIRPDRSHR